MAGSVFGTIFRVTTFGESHGAALGAVVDGCPAGLPLSEADIEPFMARRRPGQNALSTPRKEADAVQILSGVFEGKTTGTPICLLIHNTNARSADYEHLRDVYRPGHADYCFAEKYGIRDHRGGGRSSGRETAARVAAGAVAQVMLRRLGIRCEAWLSAIGNVPIPHQNDDELQAFQEKTFVSCEKRKSLTESFAPENSGILPAPIASGLISETDTLAFSADFSNESTKKTAGLPEEARQLLQKCRETGDSVGSTVTLSVTGLPAGLGEPVFDKLDANLAKAMFSIGAVKGLDIGEGRRAAELLGSESNDPFCLENGKVVKETNHSGGVLGGMSDGSELRLTVYFKPTPSISRPQKTVMVKKTENSEESTRFPPNEPSAFNTQGQPLCAQEISIHGRHDPVIGPRAAVVVEAMAALTLADALLLNMSSRMSGVENFYRTHRDSPSVL